MFRLFVSLQFYSDYFYKAPQDAIVKTLVRNRVDTYMYVQNTTVEALKLPWWRQITHNLEHYFLSGAPFMDPVFFSEDQQVLHLISFQGWYLLLRWTTVLYRVNFVTYFRPL